jgi:hypothetical protein
VQVKLGGVCGLSVCQIETTYGYCAPPVKTSCPKVIAFAGDRFNNNTKKVTTETNFFLIAKVYY